MDPLSEEVVNATLEWQQNEKRHKGFTEFHADRIKTGTALFYDAVQTFLLVFRESNALRSIRSQQLQCTESDKFNQGLQLVDSLNQVILLPPLLIVYGGEYRNSKAELWPILPK